MLCAFLPAHPLKINVFAGTPLGGFGDIASNILMARMLREQSPETTINVIVDPRDGSSPESTERLLSILEPRYKVGKASQTIDGITFYNSTTSRLPRADYLFVFSSKEDEPKAIVTTAPTAFFFLEYGGQGEEQGDPPLIVEQSKRIAKTNVFRVHTGTGSSRAGMFITDKRPEPAMSRHQLLEQLDLIPSRQSGNVGPDYSPVAIAFAYTTDAANSEAYVRAVIESSKKSPLNRQKVLVVTQHQVPKRLLLPSHVEIRSYSKLPFFVSQSLIAHSSLPSMVTGSVSPSMAFQFEKPFFYEVHTWKEGFILDFKESLIRVMPSLTGYSKQLEILLRGRLVNIEGPEYPPEQIAAVMGDSEFLIQVTEAMKKLRVEESLPENIGRFIAHLQSIGPLKGDQALHTVFLGAKLGKTTDAIRADLAAPPRPSSAKPKPASARSLEWWEHDPATVAEQLRALSPPERRKRLEHVFQKAPPETIEQLIDTLKMDPVIKKQLDTFPVCREIFARISA